MTSGECIVCSGEQCTCMCTCVERWEISRAGIVVNVFIRKIWETVGVRKRTNLHVDVAFGYANFVESVGEGGIETIGHSCTRDTRRQNSTKRSSFLAKFLDARNRPLPLGHRIRTYQSLQKEQSWGRSAMFRPVYSGLNWVGGQRERYVRIMILSCEL